MVSVQRFYRLAMWIPILIPAVILLGTTLLGLPTFDPLSVVVMTLLLSALYGAVPYSLLALWASWWIRWKSESDIRRLAVRMPFLMLVAFLPIALLIGASDREVLRGGFLIWVIAAPFILVLGYAYVGLVFWLQHIAQTRGWISTPPVLAA